MTPLAREIAETIEAEGPIGVDRFMALALAHPVHGYYVTRDPLGAAGDFTTAPEISQVFGELLGLWAASTWIAMGRPSPFVLAELGPGRGTLMADALRAARKVPGFLSACRVHLVEVSPVLRERQRAALAPARLDVAWHASLDDLPPGPVVVLANEFLDALPIRQFVRTDHGWRERLIGLAEGGGAFRFGLSPMPPLDGPDEDAPPGDLLERCPAADTVVAGLARRVCREGGAALLVDYGPAEGDGGDTFQAMRQHGYADPLDAPGEHDLTAHVRFGRLARIARREGAAVAGPVTQAAFLRSLGIRERVAALSRTADEGARAALDAALLRLTGPGPAGMGDLFKALLIVDPRLGPLPG